MKNETLWLLVRAALFCIIISFAITTRPAPAGSPDMYSIRGATTDHSGEPLRVTVFVHHSAQELRDTRDKIIRDLGPPKAGAPRENSDADGFAVIQGNKCDIHVLPIKHTHDRKRLELWGHELAHCVYGTYHK